LSKSVALRTIEAIQRASKELHLMIEQQPTVLSLSDAAALKLRELTKEETNPNVGLRVYVYSGGCSGFRYGMMLEDAPTPEDNTLDVNGVKVYVDGQSIPLLQGAEIDYVDTLMGAGFTVNNPNAVAAVKLFVIEAIRKTERASGVASSPTRSVPSPRTWTSSEPWMTP
jgi:iron-sulfur cluster insertion protein